MAKQNTQRRQRTLTKTTEETRYDVCEDYFARGWKVSKICAKYGLADTTVRTIVERFRTTDTVSYKPRGGARNSKISQAHSDFLRDLVDKRPTNSKLTAKELRRRLMAEFPDDFPHEKSISITTIRSHITNHLQRTLKKNRTSSL